MGQYSNQISLSRGNLSPEEIRRNKNQRTKQRNAWRKEEYIKGVLPHRQIRRYQFA